MMLLFQDPKWWDADQLEKDVQDALIYYTKERRDCSSDASKWFVQQCKKHNHFFIKFKFKRQIQLQIKLNKIPVYIYVDLYMMS